MNKIKINLSDLDTVILAGGLGTRLKPVLKNMPKCLAKINGKPFINILLDNCINQGLYRFIICAGYLKEQVIENMDNYSNCEIIVSCEDKLLGTAGALKNSEKHIKSSDFLLMNGDTFIDFDINELLNTNKGYIGSILLCEKEDTSDFGTVHIDNHNIVMDFKEKIKFKQRGLINAGRYYFNKKILNYIPDKKEYSLEIDLLPEIIENEKLLGVKIESKLIDIGTPDNLLSANRYFIDQTI